MTSFVQKGKLAAALLAVCFLCFGGGYVFGRTSALDAVTTVVPQEEPDGLDLQLPGEVEKEVITVDEIAAKLKEIGELATYSSEYTVDKSVDRTRYFLENVPIPGSTNTISVHCTGLVKVGYDIEEIAGHVEVDNYKQIIYIALPPSTVLDNYVIWDSIISDEKNTPLNPIKLQQYNDLLAEIEADGLQQAVDNGIHAAAEENLKRIIQSFLDKFEGYTVHYL